MAARTLVERGCTVTIFEKSRAPGGRSATRRDGETHFDHGAQYFTQRDPRLLPLMQSWRDVGVVQRWLGTIAARDEGRWSIKTDDQARWVGVPGMRSLGEHLAESLAVHYGVTVAALSQSGVSWYIVDASGTRYGPFEQVVVTAPAPQTHALLAAHKPSFAASLAAVTMRPCIAAMVVLERRPDVVWDAAFVNDDPVLSWVARNTSKPGRATHECWVLHATPTWSARYLEAELQTLAPLMVEALCSVLDTPASVRHATAHRWRFAIPDSAASPGGEAALYDAQLALGAAGDWCVGGRVEGALLSGMAVADRILVGNHQ